MGVTMGLVQPHGPAAAHTPGHVTRGSWAVPVLPKAGHCCQLQTQQPLDEFSIHVFNAVPKMD